MTPNKNSTGERDEAGLPDDVIDEIRQLASGQIKGMPDDLPQGERQILSVQHHFLVSSNFLESAASGNTGSTTVLRLAGVPTPSSDHKLESAFVTFVPDTEPVRPPAYVRSKGTIYLWIHHRQLQTVLTQLHEPSVYCWVGHFDNGHLYGDIHTGH